MPAVAPSVPVAEPSAPPLARPSEFVPHLQLRTEVILIDKGDGYSDDYEAIDTAVIELSYDYGFVRVPASDLRPQIVLSDGRVVQRDVEQEGKVRRLIESLGPVDLGCLHDCATIPGSTADYAVHLEGDIDALCAFGSQAVPRLRKLGWKVEVSSDYPCHVVEQTGGWYASIGEAEDDRDWFELELGVELEGRRVDLLPVLLDLIEERGSIESLCRTQKRIMALPLGDRRYLAVPPDRLRTIARVLTELYRVDNVPKGEKVRVPAMVPGYLERIDEAFEGENGELWEGDLQARRRARELARVKEPEPVETPKGLKATLRPYQAEGLAWLQRLAAHGAGGILADDMGLGKTLQTISHIVAEKESGRMEHPTLVVAPTSLVGNWKREIEKFAPGLVALVYHGPGRHQLADQFGDVDVIITTYGLMVRDKELFSGRRFHLFILDEAQTIKNARSQAHRTAKEIDAELKLCLSGTPVENNLEEMWAQFDFLMPGLLGDAAQFRSAFRYPIEREGNEERLETLRERVAPFILRRMKDRVAKDLPPKSEIIRSIEIRGPQRDLYESIRLAAHAQVRRVVKKKGLAASTIDILGALMKLRQVCCDPRLVRVSEAAKIENSAKFDTLFEMLPEMLDQGRRILVFSQFTSMLGLIGAELQRRGIAFSNITGSTANRQAAVDDFQEGRTRVFLISLKAGGTGLNLTRADTVIHYDPWWNPAAQAQATDRAYRIGQTRPVFVYNLIVGGSVEERMINLQRHKQALADGLLAGSDQKGVELSEDEVDDLFAPLDEPSDDD